MAVPPSTPPDATFVSECSLILAVSTTGIPSSRIEKAKNELSIYSCKRHGCASWNVTFHLTRC